MQGLSLSLRQDAPIPLDVTLECAPGELLALVGPSGSGKSTILRSIAGLYRPASARIVVDGETWHDTAASRCLPTWERRVGLVFQNFALFPHMTAQENVEASLGHLNPDARRARSQELLALVHLAGLGGRKPAELSGGQQQRVAVARAIARDPKVLLLDEPFSAVDKTTRARLYEELAGIRSRLAMPVILVTHDLDEALMLADTICLLEGGRILQRGHPGDVVRRPASVEAARLAGHRNIFPARVVEHRAKATVLDWRGRELLAARQPDWPVGSQVSWLIAPLRLKLDGNDGCENLATGTIEKLVMLTETAVLSLRIDGSETRLMTIHVPRHIVEDMALSKGARARISMPPDAIHIMAAPEKRRRS
jgi:molybdate transport system ATP-binding protein